MFYLKDARVCSLNDGVFDVTSEGMVVHPGVEYYELKAFTTAPTLTTLTTSMPTNALTSLSAVPPLTQEAPCPPDDLVFRTANTSSGTLFQFRIFKDEFRNFTAAIQLCESHGAGLYKALTSDKMNFTTSLLACPGYDFNFWINGEYHGLNNYKTTDGEPIPMTSDFWCSGKPNAPGDQNCLLLNGALGHLYDDGGCTKTDVYTICEK